MPSKVREKDADTGFEHLEDILDAPGLDSNFGPRSRDGATGGGGGFKCFIEKSGRDYPNKGLGFLGVVGFRDLGVQGFRDVGSRGLGCRV